MGTEQQDGSMVQVTERREMFTVGNHSEEDPSLMELLLIMCHTSASIQWLLLAASWDNNSTP
jgi:hypothetical protein